MLQAASLLAWALVATLITLPPGTRLAAKPLPPAPGVCAGHALSGWYLARVCTQNRLPFMVETSRSSLHGGQGGATNACVGLDSTSSTTAAPPIRPLQRSEGCVMRPPARLPAIPIQIVCQHHGVAALPHVQAVRAACKQSARGT